LLSELSILSLLIPLSLKEMIHHYAQWKQKWYNTLYRKGPPISLICAMILDGKTGPEIMASGDNITADDIYHAIQYGINISKCFTAQQVQPIIDFITPDISFSIIINMNNATPLEVASPITQDTGSISSTLTESSTSNVGEGTGMTWTHVIIVVGCVTIVIVGVYLYWKNRKKTPPTESGTTAGSSEVKSKETSTSSHVTKFVYFVYISFVTVSIFSLSNTYLYTLLLWWYHSK